uniref:single-stranded DNA-binding protein n=1 Tax=Lachnoclostridium phocaeense TaxID=1871021 RepID=UPI0026DD3E9C|nr:single-stranded DNA-binding protein [Lachnoclostridium phocaeense]
MNKVILMGRLTRDPEVRYSQGEKPLAIARYTLAVDRRLHRDGDPTADFIRCLEFGKGAEFAEKYLHQGTKIVVCGRIQTGSYTNKDGVKVYTTEVVVEEHDFAESKNNGNTGQNSGEAVPNGQSSAQRRASQGAGPQNNLGFPPVPPQQTGENNYTPDPSTSSQGSLPWPPANSADGFMNIPDGFDEDLPFH